MTMVDLIKNRLVENWKDAWKWLSIQLALLLILLDSLPEFLPALSEFIPDNWVKFLGLAIIIGRIIKQTKTAQKAEAI